LITTSPEFTRANASFMLHFDEIEGQYDLQEPANPI
jgi:hypothetical protein